MLSVQFIVLCIIIVVLICTLLLYFLVRSEWPDIKAHMLNVEWSKLKTWWQRKNKDGKR